MDRRTEDRKDLIDWWAGDVGLTFVPILASFTISLLRYGSIDLPGLIGSGELVMCAFLIIAPSITGLIAGRSPKRSHERKLFFYILLLVASLELIAYATIKTNPENPTGIVYVVSFSFVTLSVGMARLSKDLLEGA